MSTTPEATARTTARLASDGDTGERLDVRDDDVDGRHRVGGRRERGLQVHGRVLLDERGPEVVAAHAAAGRLARDEVLLAGVRVDQRDAVEHVEPLLVGRVLEVLGDAVGKRVVDLDRVLLGAAGQRHRRVEHYGGPAALELEDAEDEAAAVGAALPLGDRRALDGRLRRRGLARGGCRRRGAGGRRGARRLLVVVSTAAAGEERQHCGQREKSSHADARYPTAGSLTPSALRRRPPTASIASREGAAAASQRKKPWMTPGQRT